MTALQAILFQLLQKTLVGDRRASRLFTQVAALAPQGAAAGLDVVFVEDDYTRLLSNYPSEMQHE